MRLHEEYRFDNLLVLKGGIREWREKGYPLARASAPPPGQMGQRLYVQHCAGCHGANGEGAKGHFPPLMGDPMMTAADPWPAGYVALYGLKGRPLKGVTYPAAMPGFTKVLSLDEMAELLTYARRTFGGRTTTVEPADLRMVRRQVREAKDRASGAIP